MVNPINQLEDSLELTQLMELLNITAVSLPLPRTCHLSICLLGTSMTLQLCVLLLVAGAEVIRCTCKSPSMEEIMIKKTLSSLYIMSLKHSLVVDHQTERAKKLLFLDKVSDLTLNLSAV